MATSINPKLPKELEPLFGESEEAREMVIEVLRCGNEIVDTHDANRVNALEILERAGCLKSEAGDGNERYLKLSLGLNYSSNPDFRKSLSDLIIYSQADEAHLQILNEKLNARVKINDFEGVLIAENGQLKHVTYFIDQAPCLGGGSTPIRMIREAEIPLRNMSRRGDSLVLDDPQISYRCSSEGDDRYSTLDKLLQNHRVTKVYGNLPSELF